MSSIYEKLYQETLNELNDVRELLKAATARIAELQDYRLKITLKGVPITPVVFKDDLEELRSS